MQPSQDPSLRDISNPSHTSSKRKTTELLDNRSAYSSPDSSHPKRFKPAQLSEDLATRHMMSKSIGLKSHPEVIDLTPKMSGFQPHAGVKRLVIKNLRTTASKDVDRYYEKTWTELDAALTSIFSNAPPATPLEILCRGVEATCRRGGADKLFRHLERCSGEYLQQDLVIQIKAQASSDKVETLRVVIKYWQLWTEHLARFPCQGNEHRLTAW